MNGSTQTTEQVVYCPDCQISPLAASSAGQLAGHLVDVHGVSATKALGRARELFGVASTAAPTTLPKDREVIAARLGVKPGAPIVDEMFQRAGLTPPPPTEDPMATKKKPRLCGHCKKPGHIARHCPTKPGAAHTAKPSTRGRAPAPPPSRPSSAADALRGEIAVYETKAAKLREALAVLEN